MRGLVLASGLGLFPAVAFAQGPPESVPTFAQDSARVYPDSALKADILLVLAHPDDESAFAPYLARAVLDEGRRATVVYLTGGAPTYGEAIREAEARAALRHLGVSRAWFLDGRGTRSQVLESLWSLDHGELLERLVEVMRLTRPEVVLTFVPAALGDHSDHQASGVIATEAFDVAGDPTAFPEQLSFGGSWDGSRPWQPKRLYYFTDGQDLELAGTGPTYEVRDVSPSRGVTYEAIAAQSAAEHRSQPGFAELAAALERGEPLSEAMRPFEDWYGFPLFPEPYRFILGKSYVQGSPANDVFAGIEAGAIGFEPPASTQRAAGDRSQEGVQIELGGLLRFYRAFWAAHGIEHLARLREPSVHTRAREPHLSIPLLLVNSTPRRRVVRVSATVPEGWEVTGGSGSYEVPANTIVPVHARLQEIGSGAAAPGTAIWEAIVGGAVVSSASVRVVASRQ